MFRNVRDRTLLKIAVVVLSVILVIGLVILFYPWDHVTKNRVEEIDPGEPLFLSPLIKNGSIELARELSKVPPLSRNIESYSGLFTVDDEYDSNLFFWYFPAEVNPGNASVLAWLQGGPGVSSIYGLFLEIGPYRIVEERKNRITVMGRIHYWSKYYHVVYIDNPVGSGFSFTSDSMGYSTNEHETASNLYKGLTQFFLLFPELVKNDFYITGESYGGKYIPTLASYIHDNNIISKDKINLKGIAIGNGLIDPINQLIYADYLYALGLLNEDQKRIFERAEDQIVEYIEKKKWSKASREYSNLIMDEFNRGTLFSRLTGFHSFYNYLVSSEGNIYKVVNDFTENKLFRKNIHVGNLTFVQSGPNKARRKMNPDIMKSVSHFLVNLLDNGYKILLYSGQLDIILPYPGTINLLKKLPWCGIPSFFKAPKEQWHFDDSLAGYKTTVGPNANCSGKLVVALVRDAGHMVPRDQPVWALDLIRKFTGN